MTPKTEKYLSTAKDLPADKCIRSHRYMCGFRDGQKGFDAADGEVPSLEYAQGYRDGDVSRRNPKGRFWCKGRG